MHVQRIFYRRDCSFMYVEYIFNRDGSFMYIELYFTETVLLCTYNIQLLFNRDGSFMFSFVRGMYFLPRRFFYEHIHVRTIYFTETVLL